MILFRLTRKHGAPLLFGGMYATPRGPMLCLWFGDRRTWHVRIPKGIVARWLDTVLRRGQRAGVA